MLVGRAKIEIIQALLVLNNNEIIKIVSTLLNINKKNKSDLKISEIFLSH